MTCNGTRIEIRLGFGVKPPNDFKGGSGVDPIHRYIQSELE